MNIELQMIEELELQKLRVGHSFSKIGFKKRICRTSLIKMMNRSEISISEFDNSLLDAYSHSCKILSARHNFRELQKTISEIAFVEELKKYFKGEICVSKRIGVFSIDVFIPSVALVVEIDGKVHELPAKMSKDNYKFNFLSKLRLYFIRIENSSIKINCAKEAQYVANVIRSIRKLTGIEKKRLNRQTWLSTILSLKAQEMLELVEKIPNEHRPLILEIINPFLKNRTGEDYEFCL